MTERSLFWTDGAGHGGPYSQDELRLLTQSLLGGDDGVLRGQRSEYAVSINGSALRVASGRALVNGTLAESDTNVDLTPTVPSVGTTGLRVVLRKSWSARTVTAALLEAADGTPTPPAFTQNDGTTWEVSLATAEIETNGEIVALIDSRLALPSPPALDMLLRKVLDDDWAIWLHYGGVEFRAAGFGVGWYGIQDTGTGSAGGTLGRYFQLGATSGSDIGFYSEVNLFNSGRSLRLLGWAIPPNATNADWVFGFNGNSPSSFFTGATNCMMFQVDNAGDVACRTASGGTATVTGTSVTPDGSTPHRFEIRYDPLSGEVFYYIDDALVTSHGTNIPAPTSDMYLQCGGRSGGTSGIFEFGTVHALASVET